MAQPIDFVGLNTFIYEVCGWDPENQFYLGESDKPEEEGFRMASLTTAQRMKVSLNTFRNGTVDGEIRSVAFYRNFVYTSSAGSDLADPANRFVALMLRRNGPYGYSSWQQIRVGQNPLTRKQNKNSIFTHVVEPGPEVSFKIGDKNVVSRARFGELRKYTEVAVVSKFKPLRLVGEVTSRKGKKNKVALDFTMGNDVAFFDNKEINDYYETKFDNNALYETITDMYLDGELSSDASPFERFHALRYRETIFPNDSKMAKKVGV